MNGDNNIFDQYAELVRKFKAGDESAFTEIYENSKKMVYVTCFGILNNEQDAEDAMQETYITVYEKIGSLDAENTFVPWIKTIAANKARDKFRAKKNESSYDDVVGNEDLIEGDDNLENLPDTLILEKDKRDTFYKIIRNELSDEQFQTTLLYYYDELPVAQIAQIMNCPENTVKSKLRLARVKIKAGVEAFEKANKVSLMGAAAGTGSLGTFFNAYYGTISVPNVKSLPGKTVSAGNAAARSGANVSARAGAQAAGATAKAASTSSLPKVLGIVAALVLGVAAIIGAIFAINALKDKDNRPAESEPEETESITEVETTEETSIEETTETSETTEATTTVNDEEWKAAYLEIVNTITYSDFEDIYGDALDSGELTYDLININDDDVPELLVCVTRNEDLGNYDKEMYEESGDVVYATLFTYADGEAVELIHSAISDSPSDYMSYYIRDNKIVITGNYEYYYMITWWRVVSIDDDLKSLSSANYLSAYADIELYPDGYDPDNWEEHFYSYDPETDDKTQIGEEEFNEATKGSGKRMELKAAKSLDEIIEKLS